MLLEDVVGDHGRGEGSIVTFNITADDGEREICEEFSQVVIAPTEFMSSEVQRGSLRPTDRIHDCLGKCEKCERIHRYHSCLPGTKASNPSPLIVSEIFSAP